MTHVLTRISAIAAALLLFSAPAGAAPDSGLVASAEVGGGLTNVVSRSGAVDSVTLSGVASNLRLGAGVHRGRLDFGLTGGALQAWDTQSSSAQLTFQRPAEFLLLSIGPFVGYRPARDLPLTVGARLELARGQMTGSTATAGIPLGASLAGPSTDFFAPGTGFLGALRADYALEGRYGAATFGLEVGGGWLNGGGNQLSVVTETVTAGYRWR
jgi:hypothetical protein